MPRKHPMQNIKLDEHGVIRFVENPIVSFLLDHCRLHGVDMNTLAMISEEQGWDHEDHEQFAQLIGYSVSGAGDLSYMSGRTIGTADRRAAKILARGS
jgi:hypothetical protein